MYDSRSDLVGVDVTIRNTAARIQQAHIQHVLFGGTKFDSIIGQTGWALCRRLVDGILNIRNTCASSKREGKQLFRAPLKHCLLIQKQIAKPKLWIGEYEGTSALECFQSSIDRLT